jgi:hypothetical protein
LICDTTFQTETEFRIQLESYDILLHLSTAGHISLGPSPINGMDVHSMVETEFVPVPSFQPFVFSSRTIFCGRNIKIQVSDYVVLQKALNLLSFL